MPSPHLTANHNHNHNHHNPRSSYSQAIAKSMTIDEMRDLHHRALRDAEAKRTELRLVLASRYRELVGSSDEVLRMKERSQELHDLVHALPKLLEKVSQPPTSRSTKKDYSLKEGQPDYSTNPEKARTLLRHQLSSLPRLVHRCLDRRDVYQATTRLIELFGLIAAQTNAFPLATVLSSKSSSLSSLSTSGDGPPSPSLPPITVDPALETQLRMMYLQVQRLPQKISIVALQQLLESASYGNAIDLDPIWGAERSAAAMASVHLLHVTHDNDNNNNNNNNDRGTMDLLETYYASKSKLLLSLLDQLSTDAPEENGIMIDASSIHSTTTTTPYHTGTTSSTTNQSAEDVLSKIVRILQYDAILHPYQIFCLRRFPCHSSPSCHSDEDILRCFPEFDLIKVQSRCSKFLSSHLPLIRTKVKSVLVHIAGTTASALGQIRQSLYDKTDGAECMERLDQNGVCSWEEAVKNMVDSTVVLAGDAWSAASGSTSSSSSPERRFSLWGALFSNTFSSLVHSLLTSAFQSVHTQVISTLRASLANAPPLSDMLPHEAYRNTLQMGSDLNRALVKVSDDAHELLVHAEEREESERRLRQSLYVQTCEIMGRLICELRRMEEKSDPTAHQSSDDATRDLIVGRLCFLLKFRLTSLPTLLDPKSSPAALHSTSGMISILDMRSAFELADDNEDGIITFEEAMEAVESAFSGTQFRGAQLVQETLLIHNSSEDRKRPLTVPSLAANVTLNELTLLAARGLRHEASGESSALGIVQQSLDDIVRRCFGRWAGAALKESTSRFEKHFSDFLATASSVSDDEWRRIHASEENNSSFKGSLNSQGSAEAVRDVSPYVMCHLLDASSELSRATCPSDSLSPVPSLEYAQSLGISCSGKGTVSTLAENLRCALVRQSLLSIAGTFEKALVSNGSTLGPCGSAAIVQLFMDASFLRTCFFERHQSDFCSSSQVDADAEISTARQSVETLLSLTQTSVQSNGIESHDVLAHLKEKQARALETSDLFISSLLGEVARTNASSGGELDVGLNRMSSSAPLIRAPLPSSRRFVLLPVQADRSLSEIQLRSKYTKKETTTSRPETSTGSVMSSGLGFLSSMLKKN